MRFRTSTNSEDLDGFPCAGCYESHTGDADDWEDVLDAIRETWASIWLFRTFEERTLLRHRSQVGGHGAARAPQLPGRRGQRRGPHGQPVRRVGARARASTSTCRSGGDAEVVHPPPGVTSDEFLYFFDAPNQPITYLSHSNLVPDGETCSRPTQIHELGNALDAIHERFSPAYGPAAGNTGWYAMDVEFKFDGAAGATPTLFRSSKPAHIRGAARLRSRGFVRGVRRHRRQREDHDFQPGSRAPARERLVREAPAGRGQVRLGRSESIRTLARDSKNIDLVPRAEFLLYVARDVQLIEEHLREALLSHDVVLADRFLYTAEVLGRFGRHLPAEYIQPVLKAAAGGLAPDLVVLVDVDPVLARARRKASKLVTKDQRPPSRKGLSGVGLTHRVRRGYLELAAESPERWVLVKNEELLETAVSQVTELIGSAVREGGRAAAGRFQAGAAARSPRASESPSRPPVLASAEAALAALLRWLEQRAETEPQVAAYVLGGLSGTAVDGLRRRLAKRVPDVVLSGLSGLADQTSWDLREELLDAHPVAVARTLGGSAALDPRAFSLRARLLPNAAAELVKSLVRLDAAPAWELREALEKSHPDAVMSSLAGLDSSRAWDMRSRWLSRHQADLRDNYELSRVAAKSVQGVPDDAAWSRTRVRAVCRPARQLELPGRPALRAQLCAAGALPATCPQARDGDPAPGHRAPRLGHAPCGGHGHQRSPRQHRRPGQSRGLGAARDLRRSVALHDRQNIGTSGGWRAWSELAQAPARDAWWQRVAAETCGVYRAWQPSLDFDRGLDVSPRSRQRVCRGCQRDPASHRAFYAHGLRHRARRLRGLSRLASADAIHVPPVLAERPVPDLDRGRWRRDGGGDRRQSCARLRPGGPRLVHPLPLRHQRPPGCRRDVRDDRHRHGLWPRPVLRWPWGPRFLSA